MPHVVPTSSAAYRRFGVRGNPVFVGIETLIWQAIENVFAPA
jgi:hypothetical protein